MEIPNRSQTRGRHHHHLAPSADLVPRCPHVGLHDDLRLLADVVGVQLLKLAYRLRCAAGREVRILLDSLGYLKTRLIGHVVLQHVQDKALFNGLPHAVNMERVEAAVAVLRPEHLQRRALGCGGEGEEREVLVPPVGYHRFDKGIIRVQLFLSPALDLSVLLQRVRRVRKRRLQLQGRAPRL